MENYQELIDKYLAEDMDAGEMLAFEDRLKNERDLKDALDLEQAARKLVHVASREALKASLNNLDEKSETKVIRPLFSRHNILIAASIAVLLIAGFWIGSNFSENNEAKLFAQYHEVYRSPANQRGEQANKSNDWEQGIDLYKSKDFQSAILAFEKALADQQAPDYLIHFYLGQSYLANPRPDSQKAIESFKKVLSVENLYQQQAKWYMALAYLQMGNLNQCEILLQELVALNDFKKEAAASILTKIGEK